MQGATTKTYPLWYVEEEQRSRRFKDGLPEGAGRFWAATSSLVLGVALRLRRRPRSRGTQPVAGSRSKIGSAKIPITYTKLSNFGFAPPPDAQPGLESRPQAEIQAVRKPNGLASGGGIVLLETLICLAVLAILLPMAHHTLLKGWIKFQGLEQRENALRLAKAELSRIEAAILHGGNLGSKSFDMGVRSDGPFLVRSEISNGLERLKRVDVVVRWKTSQGWERVFLKQWVFSNERQNGR